MGLLTPALYSVLRGPAPNHMFCGSYVHEQDLTVYLFSSIDIGLPHPRRTVVVAVAAEDSAVTFTINTLTFRGVAANEQVEVVNTGVGSTTAAIYSLAVPDGRFCNIALTFSEAITGCAIAVYALYDLASATATDTAAAVVTDPADLSIDVPERGVVIAIGTNSDPALTPAWSLLNQQYDLRTAEAGYTGGMYRAGDAQTARAIACDWSANTGSEAAVAAAFV